MLTKLNINNKEAKFYYRYPHSVLTICWIWVPGIIALASCICWASMAMFFCWIRLFRPFISNCVFKCGGGWRYLQFSREQRPLGEKKNTRTCQYKLRWFFYVLIGCGKLNINTFPILKYTCMLFTMENWNCTSPVCAVYIACIKKYWGFMEY